MVSPPDGFSDSPAAAPAVDVSARLAKILRFSPKGMAGRTSTDRVGGADAAVGARPAGRSVRTPGKRSGVKSSRSGLPDGRRRPAWATLPAGPDLAAALALVDRGGLDDFDLVEYVAATDRVKSWAEATQYAALGQFARRRPAHNPHETPIRSGPADPVPGEDLPLVQRFAAVEIGLALAISGVSAQIRIEHALALTTRLGATLAALTAGHIDGVKARRIIEATEALSTADAQAVEGKVLARAGRQTPAQLGRSLRQQVLKVDPDAATKRHQAKTADRDVRVLDDGDGVATLLARGIPADAATAAFHLLDRDARTAKTHPGETRTLAALRADALIARLLGHCPTHLDLDGASESERPPAEQTPTKQRPTEAGPAEQQPTEPHPAEPHPAERHPDDGSDADTTGGTARSDGEGQAGSHPLGGCRRCGLGRGLPTGAILIQVTVPASTLMGLDRKPGHLAGFGPIPAEQARAIARDPAAVWYRLLTDPVSGTLLDYGTTRYRPPAPLARFVHARDGTCRLPICDLPAHRCDIDHNTAYPRGPTADYNLNLKCRPDHHGKQHPDVTVDQEPDTGEITWTMPTGHRYTSQPAVLHEPDEDDPFIPEKPVDDHNDDFREDDHDAHNNSHGAHDNSQSKDSAMVEDQMDDPDEPPF